MKGLTDEAQRADDNSASPLLDFFKSGSSVGNITSLLENVSRNS